MKKILVYAFTDRRRRNISYDILQGLQNIDSFTIETNTNEQGKSAISRLQNIIKENDYCYIIGLGVRSSTNTITIETRAKNKFRNHQILQGAESYRISTFLSDNNYANFRTGTAMGNSWCNLAAYLIKDQTVKLNSTSESGFFHIPNTPQRIHVFQKQIQDVIDLLGAGAGLE